jgi:Methyltransferase domain
MSTLKRSLGHVKAVADFVLNYGTKSRFREFAGTIPAALDGEAKSQETDYLVGAPASAPPASEAALNPLRAYFDSVEKGPGIWKWLHYFDIYHRHLAKFVGQKVNIVEVGIYSGGSLGIWRSYLGPNCQIHGVDIEESCKVYEKEGTRIHIGDQADRGFWRRFKQEVPAVDILIDDGGHLPEQQMITLEEMLPHLRPGGVFICEDVHGAHNKFSAYVHGLAHGLSAWEAGGALQTKPNKIQTAINSIHLYPYVVVIEKAAAPVTMFSCPKHGTEWQPFMPGPKSVTPAK